MRRTVAVCLVVALAGPVASAQAGKGQGEAKKILEGVGQQLGKDMKGLLKYTYQQRTAIESRGEERGTTLVQVAFSPEGKPLITPLSAPKEDEGRRKRPARRAIENEVKANAKEEVEALVKLSASYLTLGPEAIQGLLEKAEVSVNPSDGTVKLEASELVRPGDRVYRKFDGKLFHQTHTRVETSYDGDTVTIVATYKTLDSGLTVCQQTEIAVPAKGLKITVNTMNYQQQ